MSRKKHSVSKPTMLIAIIMAMSLLGISYGQWGDKLISQITAQTGYIDMCFEEPFEFVESEEENVFSGLKAELDSDDKTIIVTGNIEMGKDGEFVLGYSVFNHGSLPVKFEKDDIKTTKTDGLTITNKSEVMEITPGVNESDSITISIDVPEEDDSETDGIQSSSLGEDTPDAYYFEIELPYKIGSWTDKLTIYGEIKIVLPMGMVALPVPMPAMTLIPVEGEIVSGGLPEGPSDEELYGEGGITEEADDPEAVEGDSEQASEDNDGGEGPGDEELYDTGGTTEEADGEEESDNQEQADGGEATEEADEPEGIEDDNEPASDSEDEEEESDNQEQADGGEATEEADEPEGIEDDNEPASDSEDEEEGSADQVQIDAGEGN